MKLLCAVLMAISFAGVGMRNAVAGNGLALQSVARGIPHDFLYGISFEGKQGIAVGDHGLLLNTTDGGSTWTKNTKPVVQSGLLSVVRKSGKCLAGGQQGAIVRSDDCRNWDIVPPVSDARILGVDVNSKGVAYAVGGFGTLLRSSDWGKSWRPVAVDWKALLGTSADPHLYSVHVRDDGAVIVTGEFELIIRSSDDGKQWDVLHKGERSLFGLHLGDNGRLLAVGQEGLILRSADDGKTWLPLTSGSTAVLTDVWSSRDGRFVVAVGVRTVLASSDGGAIFAPDTSKTATRGVHSTVKGIDSADGGRAVLIGGSAGEILRSTF